MKVVLATAPESFFSKEYYPPPLSLGYVASSLDANGHDVVIVDSHVNEYNSEEVAKKIKSHNPEAIGITATTHNRFQAIELTRRLKEITDALIFVGGKHFTHTAVDALKNVEEIDVVVRHEGEITTPEMLGAYFNGKDLSEVKGIIYRKNNGEIKENQPRPYISDLDDIPTPAWHLYELKKYKALLEGENKTQSVGVISSRGCPNNCKFCANPAFWERTFRLRSPKKFVDEIDFLYSKYGYRGFDIWDDTFTISKKHVTEICNEMLDRKLDIKWYVRARVNTVNREILTLMKKAGAVTIGYGVESGSQRILDNINKKITIPQVLDAVKTSAELGYNVRTFWMNSLPGETLEDIDLTLELMKKMYQITGTGSVPDHANFTIIYPGTEIEEIAKREGLLPTDFSWNTYQTFAAPRLLNADPTLPLYENPDLKIEQILAHLYRKNVSLKNMIRKGFRSLVRIKSFEELKIAFGVGRRYLFGN